MRTMATKISKHPKHPAQTFEPSSLLSVVGTTGMVQQGKGQGDHHLFTNPRPTKIRIWLTTRRLKMRFLEWVSGRTEGQCYKTSCCFEWSFSFYSLHKGAIWLQINSLPNINLVQGPRPWVSGALPLPVPDFKPQYQTETSS